MLAVDAAGDSERIPREVAPPHAEVQKEKQGCTKAAERVVPQAVLTRCSWRAAIISAIRPASRPTPWICSDDFE
jgi:hypothetical protein